MGYAERMRIELVLEDGVEAALTIDEDTGAVYLHGKSTELISLSKSAGEAAAGPPLWAGPLEAVRSWLDERPGIRATEVGVPALPSEPGRVY